MNPDPQLPPELSYWKAAISQLPSQEMRDAAWEFFLRHWGKNPEMADAFSGMILVMQANGVYMLSLPERFQWEVIDPLQEERTLLMQKLDIRLERQQEMSTEMRETVDLMGKHVKSIEGVAHRLESFIDCGWKRVDIRELTQRVTGEFNRYIYEPFQEKAQELGVQIERLDEASDKARDAVESFRRAYFRGHLLLLSLGLLLVMGGCFAFGWQRLSAYHERSVAEALERIEGAHEKNRAPLQKLSELGVTIRVTPVIEGGRKPERLAIVMEGADDVKIREQSGSKEGAILFYPPKR